MRQLHGNSTHGGVWLREYSKALVLVNTQTGVLDGSPPGTGIAIPLPSGKNYVDLWGKAVAGPTVTLPPVGAAVLLEESEHAA
jgi:hypothetical protein